MILLFFPENRVLSTSWKLSPIIALDKAQFSTEKLLPYVQIKRLFSTKSIDIFLISPQNHVGYYICLDKSGYQVNIFLTSP